MIKFDFKAIMLLAGILIIIGLVLYISWTAFGIIGFLISAAIICLFIGHALMDD